MAEVRNIYFTLAITTYFLYDDGGQPVLEETYNTSTNQASLSAVNLFGADGWRARYDETSSQFYAYSFDPQGNVIQRQNSGNTLGYTYDTASYEGYGRRGADYTSGGVNPAPHQDPAGFGGQFGYYGDHETGRSTTLLGLLCLTHRYYDPGTGRFVTRDPSGYGGGINLYGFAGDNPVNMIDPNGTDAYVYIFRGTKKDPWYDGAWKFTGTHAMVVIDNSSVGPIAVSYAGHLSIDIASKGNPLDIHSLSSVYKADSDDKYLDGNAYHIVTTKAGDAKAFHQLAQWYGVSDRSLLAQLKKQHSLLFTVNGHNDGTNPISYALGLDNCAAFTSAILDAEGLRENNMFDNGNYPFGRYGIPTQLDDELSGLANSSDSNYKVLRFPVNP